ncbi:MAG: amidohydrolase family protein [Gammaproteobacteria bacterium]
MTAHAKTAEIRSRLNHPIIDSDGHLTEFVPIMLEYFDKAGGTDLIKRFQAEMDKTFLSQEWYRLDHAQRRQVRAKRNPFWGAPTGNTVDLATSYFPDLMYERMDDLGLDFAVLYPGLGIVAQGIADDDVRRTVCRALNDYYADLWGTHPDRYTPVATIPMHTPQEAIAELEYACGKRGMKAAMLASHVRRPIAALAQQGLEVSRYAFWLDTFGIDSEHDYDPVWSKCQELRVAPSFHGPGEGWGSRVSISNHVYNHVGHFAAAQEAVCKSLLLGGVPRRFPGLRFLFLEGGVGWARSLLADLVGHFEKRSLPGLMAYTNPRNLKRDLFAELYQRYGGALRRNTPIEQLLDMQMKDNPQDPTDDFALSGIKSKQDLRDQFLTSFFFGCEPDDPVTSSAFDARRNPFRARLNAVYGSDIGHWDVPDMGEVVEEAWEMVEKEMIDQNDFRDFVFANPVKLWTATNPDFFKGTRVETQVSKAMAA